MSKSLSYDLGRAFSKFGQQEKQVLLLLSNGRGNDPKLCAQHHLEAGVAD